LEVINIKLSNIYIDDFYNLSHPLRPEICYQIMKKISPLPAIIINSKNSLIHGIDIFYYHKAINRISVEALKIDILPEDALVLNYNLKEKLFGINLYEKLLFMKKMRPYINPDKLQKKTKLNIPINPELLSKLDLLCSNDYKNVLIDEKICLQAALKICQFKKKEQKVLLKIFQKISFSISQQLKLIEMVEELIFRDKCAIQDIMNKVKINRFLDQEKPQKKVLSQIFELRYPLYTKMEKEWQEEVKKLKLPNQVSIFHAPFFEKKEIELRAKFKNLDEVKEMLGKRKK
jgi:hypothetical protein